MNKMKAASPRADVDGAVHREHFHQHFKAEEEKSWTKDCSKGSMGPNSSSNTSAAAVLRQLSGRAAKKSY